MAKRWLEISVGGLLIGGIVALLLVAIQISGSAFTASSSSYRIYALFDNVAGLSSKARVTIAGVTVGEVVAVGIDQNTLMARVDMNIDGAVDYLTYDTSASILTAGLLGEKYISLSVGADAEILAGGDMIEYTQSAIVLEELIGKLLLNIGGESQ